jgi:branched-chain amino acid transport system substrate-binding protein
MLLALVVGCLLSLPGFAIAQETIKLGVVGPHTGDLASYGIPSIRAAELVVREINAKGGILGRQVELLVEDDVCKPELATNAATKLVSRGVHVVLGHICSGATRAAMGIYKDAKVIAMSPSATNPALTQSGDFPNFYRTIASDDEQARLGVRFALENLKAKRIAIVHDKGDYGKGYAEFAKRFVEEAKTAEVVLFEGITPGAVDYSAIVKKIRQSKADTLIYGGYHPEAASIVSTMRKRKMKTNFVSADGVKDNTFIKVAGKSAEGVYATGPKDVSKNPLAMAFNDAHRKTFNTDPGAFFLNAVAATQSLLNGIQKAGSTDSARIEAVLRGQTADTPLGQLKFDRRGDAIGVGFSVYQVRKGAFVELKF